MPRPDVLDKLLKLHACLEAGIAPLWDPSDSYGYAFVPAQKAFASLDPAEARKIKRKFRKLWRKLAKVEETKRLSSCAPEKRAEVLEQAMKHTFGARGKPVARQLNRRKIVVAKHLLKTVVNPARAASDHPTNDKDAWYVPP